MGILIINNNHKVTEDMNKEKKFADDFNLNMSKLISNITNVAILGYIQGIISILFGLTYVREIPNVIKVI